MIMKSLLKIAALSFLAAAMAGLPGQLYAQATNKPTPEKKPAVEKKQTANAEKHPSAHPIRGKLAALDKAVGRRRSGRIRHRLCEAGRGRENGREDPLFRAEAGSQGPREKEREIAPLYFFHQLVLPLAPLPAGT